MKILELAIMCSVLAAIMSTFFLYQTHFFTPLQTASVITALKETTTPNPSSNTTTDSATSTHTATSSIIIEKTEDAADAIAGSLSTTTDIVVETIPFNQEYVDRLTARIVTLTNTSRSQNGLPALISDPSLATIASMRTDDMLERNYFSHTTPEGCDVSCRFKQQHYITTAWGENLAEMKEYQKKTAIDIGNEFMSKWLSSETHRKNILSTEFTRYGIGINTKDHTLVATIIFAK